MLWLVLEASVELWAGPLGRAPLDLAIDEAAAVATRHLARGDRVGLLITADALHNVIDPDHGPAHAAKLAHALTIGCGTYDAARSDLDESDVAVRVLEHLRPLDARGLSDVRRGDIDKLAARADAMRARAPFAAAAPLGRALRERTLRRYLASFGIDSPPRIEADRSGDHAALLHALGHIARGKPRASLVHVISPLPDERQQKPLGEAVRRITRGGAALTWSTPPIEPSLSPPWDDPSRPAKSDGDEEGEPLLPRRPSVFAELAPIAADAVRTRARAAEARREGALKKIGVRLVRHRRPPALAAEGQAAAATPDASTGEGSPKARR